MNCPKCGHPLTESKNGHLCLNCGYVHRETADQPVPPTLESARPAVAEQPVNAAPDATSPSQPPAPPKPMRRWRRRLFTGLIAVAAIVIVALAYLLPGLLAARRFQSKVKTSSSFQLQGQMVMQASSFLTILQSNLNFSGALNKTKSQGQLSYNGVFGSRTYNGEGILAGGLLYNKLSGSDLPFIRYNQGVATYHLIGGQWYQTKPGNELYKYYCETRPDTKYPSGLIWLEALNSIKLRPAPYALYFDSVAGHRTTHLKGSINSASLAAAWAKINNAQPDDCQIELAFGDLSQLAITYDLWTSPGFDQIKLHLKSKQIGLTGTITLQLSGYGQPTTISAPTNALDLSGIFGARAAIQARDYQRRADVDSLKTALDAYFKANRTLPTDLASLAPKYITTIPHDPVTGAGYNYVQIKRKTYTISTILEDNGALYSDTGP